MKSKTKLTFALALLIMGAFLLASCGAGDSTPEAGAEAPEGDSPGAESTAEPSASEADATGIGLCANTYFPVVLGATQSYTGTGGPEGSYSFITTVTDVREDGFTITTDFDELTITHNWACTTEGIRALEYGGGAAGQLTTAGSTATYTTTNVEGVTIPSSISVGDSWTQTFEVDFVQTIPEFGEVSSSGTAVIAYEALGLEEVTVPGGTFMAMKLSVSSNFSFVMVLEGAEVPLEFGDTGTTWYAENVGMVSTISTGEIFGVLTESTIELTSYMIP